MSETLIIEGRQYISSRRAAEIAGYTNDYVGQLCRAGKLLCRMVGRFWYVDESSIIKHKNESIKPNQTVFKKSEFSTAGGSIEEVTLVPIKSPIKQIPKQAQSAAIEPPPSWQWTDLDATEKNGSFGRVVRSPYALVAPTAIAIIFIFVMSVTGNARFHAASSGSISSLGSSYGSNVATVVESAGQQLSSVWNALVAGSSGFVSNAIAFISGGRLGARSGDMATNAVNGSTIVEPSASSVIPLSEVGKVTAERGGLVVMPITGTSTDDQAKLEKSIQNSFSDTVVVKPDSSGTAGVIQPVFRSTAGHDFMYVLVPVKATSTSATN